MTLTVAPVVRRAEREGHAGDGRVPILLGAARAGSRLTAGASVMITHHSGLAAPSSRSATPNQDTDQERERLRRELLRRIMDREARRRALRLAPR